MSLDQALLSLDFTFFFSLSLFLLWPLTLPGWILEGGLQRKHHTPDLQVNVLLFASDILTGVAGKYGTISRNLDTERGCPLVCSYQVKRRSYCDSVNKSESETAEGEDRSEGRKRIKVRGCPG